MPKAKKLPPKRIRKNFQFPEDLALWADTYAKDNNTTMTRLLIDYLTNLRKQTEADYVAQI